MDAVDVLIEARLWIDKGWCQGRFGQYEAPEFGTRTVWREALGPQEATSVCIEGAFNKAVSTSWGFDTQASRRALWLLGCVIGTPDIPAWNDAPERTKEEVLEAFDRAIALGLESA